MDATEKMTGKESKEKKNSNARRSCRWMRSSFLGAAKAKTLSSSKESQNKGMWRQTAIKELSLCHNFLLAESDPLVQPEARGMHTLVDSEWNQHACWVWYWCFGPLSLANTLIAAVIQSAQMKLLTWWWLPTIQYTTIEQAKLWCDDWLKLFWCCW